jgi:lysophospholipase L1-like esterase
MKTVLCFGDSNTYGLNPHRKEYTDKEYKKYRRFDDNTRWTGILDKMLAPYGRKVAEEGLCGRTTVFDDRLRNDRNGSSLISMVIDTHSPVEYIILMLGTNDCKTYYNASPYLIGKGIEKLINQVKEFDSDIKIMVVSPVHLGKGVGEKGYDEEFNEDSVNKSYQLKKIYSEIAKREGCIFLSASDYAEPSEADREHIDSEGHKKLAEGIFNTLVRYLDS